MSEYAMRSLFPAVSFDLIDDDYADELLARWGHYLGPCRRPFGRQSFGLEVFGEVISVAVSASTPNGKCAGYDRDEVVELARLCTHPDHRWATRVCLRLWREIAPRYWSEKYWPVKACVAYANSLRHSGDVYRFDGWKKAATVKGGVAGGGWQRKKRYDPKTVWVWEIPEERRVWDGRKHRSRGRHCVDADRDGPRTAVVG